MTTKNLQLEFLLQSQVYPEIIFNDAIYILDAISFKTAKAVVLELPSEAQFGDIYLISSQSVENANKIAIFLQNKGWKMISPKIGWDFYVISENKKYRFTENGFEVEKVGYEVPKITMPTEFAPVALSGNYDDLTNAPQRLSQFNNDRNYGTLLTGDIKHSIQSVDHNNWLLCDGREISRITYANLFTLIGESFGIGDGASTFNLPNAKGRVLGASGQGAGLTNRNTGEMVGDETHTLTEAEMPSHKHSLYGGYSLGTPPARLGIVSVFNGSQHPITQGSHYTHNVSGAMDETGNNQPHNNMQPTLFIGNVFIYVGT